MLPLSSKETSPNSRMTRVYHRPTAPGKAGPERGKRGHSDSGHMSRYPRSQTPARVANDNPATTAQRREARSISARCETSASNERSLADPGPEPRPARGLGHSPLPHVASRPRLLFLPRSRPRPAYSWQLSKAGCGGAGQTRLCTFCSMAAHDPRA